MTFGFEQRWQKLTQRKEKERHCKLTTNKKKHEVFFSSRFSVQLFDRQRQGISIEDDSSDVELSTYETVDRNIELRKKRFLQNKTTNVVTSFVALSVFLIENCSDLRQKR